ncbi:MAG: AN1-type zinc finger domain-containing protein [Promethearchaeota archaeon]
MTSCNFCGEDIGYLPFRCKYCQKTFCKKHRLPENHQCTFEFKYDPLVPKTSTGGKPLLIKTKKLKSKSKQQKQLNNYLKRQDQHYIPRAKRIINWSANFGGTKTLLIFILAFSIAAAIFALYNLQLYIYFSLNGLLYNYAFHTILSSLFITEINLFSSYAFIDIFFLVIMLFFTYLLSRSIEIRFGSFFLFKLFMISSFFSLLLFILLRFTLIGLFPIILLAIPMGFAWGGILGLISYSLFPMMNQEITALMMIIPVRVKGKTFLIIIILLRILPILFNPLSFIIYLPDLGGIFGAYIVFRYQIRRK